MDSIEIEEGWLATPDGIKLYTKTWKPNDTPKARLVFLHGFSDHCNWYPVLFSTLAQKGVKVYSFDQRGWGRSVHEPKQKGLTGPNEQIMADITTFIKSLPAAEQEIPLFLMGHSMGGGETAVYSATGPRDVVGQIRGFLLESPLIALVPSAKPWKATLVVGKMASRLFPHVQQVRQLDPSTMSRDPQICQEWVEDPLNHDTATLECLAAMMERTAGLEEGRVVVKEGLGEGGKTRLWVGHGTKDGACDYDACRKWFESLSLKDKEFHAYDGWYHKLHSEPNGDDRIFANDVATFIVDRCGPISESTKSKL